MPFTLVCGELQSEQSSELSTRLNYLLEFIICDPHAIVMSRFLESSFCALCRIRPCHSNPFSHPREVCELFLNEDTYEHDEGDLHCPFHLSIPSCNKQAFRLKIVVDSTWEKICREGYQHQYLTREEHIEISDFIRRSGNGLAQLERLRSLQNRNPEDTMVISMALFYHKTKCFDCTWAWLKANRWPEMWSKLFDWWWWNHDLGPLNIMVGELGFLAACFLVRKEVACGCSRSSAIGTLTTDGLVVPRPPPPSPPEPLLHPLPLPPRH